MVREYTKWDYELRSGQHPHDILARALEIALAAPMGPVYLTLPREVLTDPCTVSSTSFRAATRMAPVEPKQKRSAASRGPACGRPDALPL